MLSISYSFFALHFFFCLLFFSPINYQWSSLNVIERNTTVLILFNQRLFYEKMYIYLFWEMLTKKIWNSHETQMFIYLMSIASDISISQRYWKILSLLSFQRFILILMFPGSTRSKVLRVIVLDIMLLLSSDSGNRTKKKLLFLLSVVTQGKISVLCGGFWFLISFSTYFQNSFGVLGDIHRKLKLIVYT